MAERSRRTLNNQYAVEPVKTEELGIDPPSKLTYNNVVNQLASRVIREVNGHRYEWSPGGVTKVLSEDTDALRNLKLGGTPCCGNRPTIIFQVLED